jgi:nitrite reductase (NADH) large subunit
MEHFVIVGSGVAAVHAAKAIRDQNPNAEISILGEENHLPYNRIKLTKGLFSDLYSDKVLIKKEKWYRDNNISVKTGTRVVSVSPERKEVETADGSRISYHKLLLCMGATNRKLSIEGADLPNVHTIRDLRDADRLKANLVTDSHAVIIGGGVQGLETAWALFEAGIKVSVIEAFPRLMGRQLDQRASRLVQDKLEQAGVQVTLNAAVAAISGTEQVEGVVLTNGTTIPCEHVVYSIGIVPNTELIRNTDIEIRNGVIVNERMETSTPNVYAAGDLAEFNGCVEGLWGGAIEQGKIAGTNMAESTAVYERAIPVTLFNAFGTSLFSMGQVDEGQCDMTLTSEEDGVYTRIFVKDNTMVGAVSFEGAAASLPYKSAIEQKLSLAGLDLQNTTVKELMTTIQKELTV